MDITRGYWDGRGFTRFEQHTGPEVTVEFRPMDETLGVGKTQNDNQTIGYVSIVDRNGQRLLTVGPIKRAAGLVFADQVMHDIEWTSL